MTGNATRVIKTITVVLAGLTIALPQAATASVTATSKTVVYGFGNFQVGWAHPEVRPAHAAFGLAGEDGIKSIRWHDWRRSSASGHGLHLLFTGTGFKDQSATIVLSGVRTHKGHRYFSHLVMRWTTKNNKHHTETLNWRYDKGVGWLWLGNFQ
jgi:hypothetical protein